MKKVWHDFLCGEVVVKAKFPTIFRLALDGWWTGGGLDGVGC